MKKLYRTEGKNKLFFGVCGGLAEYFDVDPTVVRVIWALCTLMAGFGVLAYLVCALLIPTKSSIYSDF